MDIVTRAASIVARNTAPDGSVHADRVPYLINHIACAFIGAANAHAGRVNEMVDPWREALRALNPAHPMLEPRWPCVPPSEDHEYERLRAKYDRTQSTGDLTTNSMEAHSGQPRTSC